MKTFITIIPRQREGQLSLTQYIPAMCDELAYGKTRFPIVPVIAHHAAKEKKIRILPVIQDNEWVKHNFEKHFLDEVKTLESTLDVMAEMIPISVPDSESIDTHLKLFSDVIEKIEDGSRLHACATYGTKPASNVISLALSYAYRLKKDVTVERIVYGQFLHRVEDGAVGTLYDTTPLFFMDAIVNRLAEARAHNPERAIRLMLGLEQAEGDE